MAKHDGFRDALERGDVRLLRRMWSSWFPQMPQPANAHEAEVVMHHARTQAETVSLKARAYSHRWLTERSLPSALPDHLRMRAERMYPKVVEAVGISVNFRNPLLRPAGAEIQRAMSDVVEDMYASGDRDPALVRSRMLEAKDRTMAQLFGRTGK